MKNDGTEAERSFVSYWEAVGHIERFRDRKDLMAINKGRKVNDFKKPADYIVSSTSIPLHYAEVKSTIDPKSFSFNKIQDGQSKAALMQASRGSQSFLFYIFSYATGQWYIMSCVQYAAVLAEGRKSVRFEELQPWHK